MDVRGVVDVRFFPCFRRFLPRFGGLVRYKRAQQQ